MTNPAATFANFETDLEFDAAKLLILRGGFKYCLFHPYLGKWSNLTVAYFSDRLVQPPTRIAFGRTFSTNITMSQGRIESGGADLRLLMGQVVMGQVVRQGSKWHGDISQIYSIIAYSYSSASCKWPVFFFYGAGPGVTMSHVRNIYIYNYIYMHTSCVDGENLHMSLWKEIRVFVVPAWVPTPLVRLTDAIGGRVRKRHLK